MTARGLLRVAWPVLALCALAAPATAGPCIDDACVSPPQSACLNTLCIMFDGPEPNCQLVAFTGHGLLPSIDYTCLLASMPIGLKVYASPSPPLP
jgi:hypothetical protein